MPIKLKPGNKKTSPKSTYEIVRELNQGMFASSYEAKSALGRRVFFKEYKSPTPTVSWYRGYVEYQTEIKKRIELDPVTRVRTYEFIDFFEDKFFYQVFEFVEGGMSLQGCLDKLRDAASAASWKDRVYFARVMMAGIAGFHALKIIHTDLKPDNIYLIPNKDSAGDYYLRIIDVDFAILQDKQAPWHGVNGYVGTPKYQSPEHLRGEIPTPASDTFTCALMLCELLGGGHPFRKEEDYGNSILAGDKFIPFKLEQSINKVDDVAFLEGVINTCFNPDPENRPTARQVADALLGKKFEWIITPTTAPSPVITPTTSPVVTDPKPSLSTTDKSVAISFGGKQLTLINIDSEFGKRTFKGVHDDAQFLSEKQFRIYRDPATKCWLISHETSATNETIVNGSKLVAPVSVADGMRIAVGNSAKGIEKFTLTLNLVVKE